MLKLLRKMLLATIVSSVLHSFDAWGKPVPQINMGGREIYRTKLGGFVGLMISIVISTFTISRIIKMVNLDNPNVY
jgi:hypothetical protein